MLDPETGRLLEGERVVQLAPKPFETLLYLARHQGRVVPKNELIDRLWAGIFVTEDVLVQSIVEIRRALGDHARRPQYVETIPRRGYRFIHEVRSADETSPRPAGATSGAEASHSDRASRRPRRPHATAGALQVAVASFLVLALLAAFGVRLVLATADGTCSPPSRARWSSCRSWSRSPWPRAVGCARVSRR